MIAADKTSNFYKLETPVYYDLLERNISKSYKKSQLSTIHTIHAEDNNITAKLGIDDRVESTASKEAFVTLKDHKPNFCNKPSCRLINPTKPEIGKISKQILDCNNKKIISETNMNQWKNTESVIEWFQTIENNQHHSFISFDIVEFYPAISQNLLLKALNFGSTYDIISEDEKHIIMHAKNSYLFHKQQPWQKKGTSPFDITMGSYDGAETCELVGCYLLSQLQEILGRNIGLYRDGGLVISKGTPKAIEKY